MHSGSRALAKLRRCSNMREPTTSSMDRLFKRESSRRQISRDGATSKRQMALFRTLQQASLSFPAMHASEKAQVSASMSQLCSRRMSMGLPLSRRSLANEDVEDHQPRRVQTPRRVGGEPRSRSARA